MKTLDEIQKLMQAYNDRKKLVEENFATELERIRQQCPHVPYDYPGFNLWTRMCALCMKNLSAK